MGFIKIIAMASALALSYVVIKRRRSNISDSVISNENPINTCHGNCSSCHHHCQSETEESTEAAPVEEPISEITESVVEEEEEIDVLEQMRLEEEAAEECYGNCMNCSNFSKEDDDFVLGFCSFHNVEMLEDDGCYDFDSIR